MLQTDTAAKLPRVLEISAACRGHPCTPALAHFQPRHLHQQSPSGLTAGAGTACLPRAPWSTPLFGPSAKGTSSCTSLQPDGCRGSFPEPLSALSGCVSAQPAHSLPLVAACLDGPTSTVGAGGTPATPCSLRLPGKSPRTPLSPCRAASRRSLRTRSRSSQHASTCRPPRSAKGRPLHPLARLLPRQSAARTRAGTCRETRGARSVSRYVTSSPLHSGSPRKSVCLLENLLIFRPFDACFQVSFGLREIPRELVQSSRGFQRVLQRSCVKNRIRRFWARSPGFGKIFALIISRSQTPCKIYGISCGLAPP